MAFPSANPDTAALLLPDNGTQRDEFINGLVQGSTWEFGGGPRILTYSLNINEESGTYPGTPEPGPGGTWSAAPEMTAAVMKALGRWADVANIDFQRISSGDYYFESSADLAFTLTGDDLDRTTDDPTDEVLGEAVFPSPDYVAEQLYPEAPGIDRTNYPMPEGDVFLDNADEQFDFLKPGGVGFAIILHEIGHALGLKHPHDDGASGRPTFEDLGIDDMDRMRHTVMSYDIVAPEAGPSGFAATPMPLDILAIQRIYGANLVYHTGADVYRLDNRNYRTIWDAGGRDTLDASSWARPDGVVLDLREGAFSGRLQGARRTAIAYDAVIENAIGSGGDDELIGNGAANRLQGSAGADRLTGGSGADKLFGGTGGDMLVGSSGDLRLHGGGGFDTLQLAGGDLDLRSASGDRVMDIERIRVTGAGGNRITLDAASVLDLSTSKDILRVIGDSADTVVIDGHFIDRGLSGGFHRYQLGAATLLVDADITVVV